MNKNIEQKGFTLIELLVVIAIIAVLSVVVILTLNPAVLLAQARDSSRISDMATFKSAISLYLADVPTPSMSGGLATSTCFSSAPAGTVLTGTPGIGCNGRMNALVGGITASTSAALAPGTGGNGWIPINFGLISAGSPIGSEPVDPTNNGTYFYSYMTTGSPNFQFEVDAHMESTKFQAGGTNRVEDVDGGDRNGIYEVGTNLTL